MSKKKGFYIIVGILLVSFALTSNTAQHSTAQHSTAQHSTAQHSTAQANLTDQLWISEIVGKGAYPQSIIDDFGNIFLMYIGSNEANYSVCYRLMNSTTRLWEPEKILTEGKFKIMQYHYSVFDNLIRIIDGLPSAFIVNAEGNQEIQLYQYNYTRGGWDKYFTVPKQNSTAEISRVQVEIDNNQQLHLVWLENNTESFVLYYQKYNFTNKEWSTLLSFEPGFAYFGELIIKNTKDNIPIIMTRMTNNLSIYKVVNESIQYIIGYKDVGNAYLNTFDVDESDGIHVINSYKGKYIDPNGISYALPYDKISKINFFSARGATPYLILGAEHYLFVNGEWVLNKTIVFGSVNSLMLKNRVIINGVYIENSTAYCRILRTKYKPEISVPQSEYEYSQGNISFIVHDNELRNNASYSLMVNSSVINENILTSDTPIHVASGLELGEYNFTLNFKDGYENSFSRSRTVYIINKKPIITRDFQQIFVKGEINALNWSVLDKSVKNPSYSIFINGESIVINDILESDKISLDIKSLAPGTYQIKVEVNDGLGEVGDLTTGIMIQTVQENGDTNDNNQDQLKDNNMTIVYAIIGTVGLVSIAGMIVFSKKHKKVKKMGERNVESLAEVKENEE